MSFAPPITTAVYRKAENIDHRTIGGEGFIVSPGQAEVHALNSVAAHVFEHLDGVRDVGQLVGLVCDEFEVEHAVAEQDVIAFLRMLETKGLAHQ
jgi:transcriptional regulator GlxA family with amidase domain